jgi:hypothetical protein
MKQLFTFLSLMGGILLATAQAPQTIDFEDAGVGASWTWTASDDDPTFTVIANPHKTGINTSDKVVEFVAKTTDKNWALAHSEGIGEFTFDATNNSVKIKVYKPTISDVAIKFEGTSPAKELKVANTLTNQWEELTFDFSSVNGNTYNKIVVIPDFVAPYVTGEDRAQNNTMYLDDIVAPDGLVSSDPAPNDAPTAPTEPAGDVLSIYSDAYTDVSATWNPSWGQSTVVTDEVIASNNLKKYKSFNFSGIEPSSTVSKSSYNSIKLDYWTADAANIKVKFRDYGPNGVYDASGDDVEQEITHTVTTTSSWQTIQINLADYTSLTTGNLGQIVLSSATSGGGNSLVYFDNIYFSSTTLSSKNILKNNISIYPNPVADFVTVEGRREIQHASIYDLTGRQVLRTTPNKAVFTLDTADLQHGLYLLTIKTDDQELTTKLVK